MTPSDKLPANETSYDAGRHIVVIGRQFGCGARMIGRKIAEALNADYYDKTLLAKAAESFGFSKSLFDSADERRPSWIRSLLQFNYGVGSSACEFSNIDSEGLYKAQSQVIIQLPSRGDCVIVGRTADYVLRDHPGLLSVFLHAPIESRALNILNRNDASSHDKAIEIARKMDRKREAYYNYFTNRNWGEAQNYHLSIDTSRFSPDEIVAIIISHLNKS